jgi:hypothetical protein
MTIAQRQTIDRLKDVVEKEQNRINRGQGALIKAEEAGSDEETEHWLKEAQLELE